MAKKGDKLWLHERKAMHALFGESAMMVMNEDEYLGHRQNWPGEWYEVEVVRVVEVKVHNAVTEEEVE